MSIVAYYIDVDAAQLAALRSNPPLVWTMADDPRFAQASRMDVDQDWQVLSWLASPARRSESCRDAAVQLAKATTGQPNPDQVARASAKLGCQPAPPGRDLLLDAIEGRGSDREREPTLDFGLGAARVFAPQAVRQIAVTFAQFPLSALRSSFDREKMARFHVGVSDWRQEDDSVRDEFLVPSFVRLSDFYQRAAKLNHYVLVLRL